MKPMELAKVALGGGGRYALHVATLTIHGKMNARHLWYGMKGAKEYVEAVARGDLAEDAVIDVRRGVGGCGGCASRVRDEQNPGRLGYCGEPFVDHGEAVLPTCGCVLEGKTAVRSARCQQGRW